MFLHIVYIQSRFPFKINFKHTKRNDSVEEISGVFKESKATMLSWVKKCFWTQKKVVKQISRVPTHLAWIGISNVVRLNLIYVSLSMIFLTI